MSKNVDSIMVTVSVKIYECLLATYPAAFRHEYGLEMKQLFHDQCRDAWRQASAWGVAFLWLRVLSDWAKTSVVEHLADKNPRAAFIRTFALALAAAFVGSALVAYWSPRIYSSATTIEVRKNSVGTNPDAVWNSDPYFLTTQFKIIESYSILTNVIVNLRLDEKLARQNGANRWTIDDTFNYLGKTISVDHTRMTSLIEIAVRNPDPQLAANIANAIVSSYRESRLDQAKENNARVEAVLRSLPRPVPFQAMLPTATVMIRNPARPDWNSVVRSKSDVFLKWAFGGMLLALAVGGVSAWRAFLTQRFSYRQCPPS